MHVKLYVSGSFCIIGLSEIANILHKDNICKGKDLYIGRLEFRGVAGACDVRVAQYCIQEYICYVKISLFSVSGPICVAIISLYSIVSNGFLCKINICCCKIFTVER